MYIKLCKGGQILGPYIIFETRKNISNIDKCELSYLFFFNKMLLLNMFNIYFFYVDLNSIDFCIVV